MTAYHEEEAKELRDSMIFALIDGISDKEAIHEYLMSKDIYNEANYDCEDDIVPQPSRSRYPAEYADAPLVAANRRLEESSGRCSYVVVDLKPTPAPETAPQVEAAPKAEAAQKTAKPEATEKKASPNMIVQLMDFMRENYEFRYNVLTRQPEVKFPGEREFVVMSKQEFNTIAVNAQVAGLNCWDRDIKRIIESRLTKVYHPLKDYIDRLPKWDGIDRVTPFMKRISSKSVWVRYGPIWMRAMVAQWMGNKRMKLRANSVVPIIVSTQQGWGKSTICRLIMPPRLRMFFCENFNINAKNLETMLAELGLVNIDEFDRLSPRKMAELKNLVQQSEINIVAKYSSTRSSFHRIASFIATSNRRDLLTDGTGSRRFLVVEPEHPIDCDMKIDYRQLYAQLKEEVLAGKPIYFDKEAEREIQASNRDYRQITPEEEALRMHVNVVDKDTPGAQLLNSTQIFNILKRREKNVMHGVSASRISRLLPELGRNVHTMYGNGYYVIVT